MDPKVQVTGSQTFRSLSVRPQPVPRAGYVLAVAGALAVVTFTLVYLTTLSYASIF